MIRFVLFALLSVLILPADSIQCQQCTLVTNSTDGVVAAEPAEETSCVTATCSNATKCAYGYADFTYNKTTDSMTEVIEVNVQYFKGCKDSQFDSCGAMKDAILSGTGASTSEIATSVVKDCDIRECATDNCNDIAPTVFNPSGSFQRIQCYSCERTTMGGDVDGMNANHECNTTNIVTCPLGVTHCTAGNSASNIQHVPYVTEYRKGCDGALFSNCDSVCKFLESMNAVPETCSVHKCQGNLCNTQTAAETAQLVNSSITCQECRLTTTSTDGVVASNPSVDSTCVTRTCATGCAYGYATFRYNKTTSNSGFDLMGMSTSNYEEIVTTVQYFKGCKDSQFESCEAMKDAMASDSGVSSGEIESCEVEECVIRDCDTDNCNDLAPKFINPSGSFERIQCFSCEHTTLNGVEPEDNNNHACNATNTVTCPLGVTQCTAGNLHSKLMGVPFATEYRKTCDGTSSSDCSSMYQSLESMNAVPEKCAIRKCRGNLCNNQTAAEVTQLEGSFGYKPRVDFLVLLAILVALLQW